MEVTGRGRLVTTATLERSQESVHHAS
jgi:hypothetical protein